MKSPPFPERVDLWLTGMSPIPPFPGHGRGSMEPGTVEALEGRKEAFSYLLTLLHSHTEEWSGVLPAIDISGMEHLAWCLDALHYLLEVWFVWVGVKTFL